MSPTDLHGVSERGVKDYSRKSDVQVYACLKWLMVGWAGLGLGFVFIGPGVLERIVGAISCGFLATFAFGFNVIEQEIRERRKALGL